jgi:hypothetical protein
MIRRGRASSRVRRRRRRDAGGGGGHAPSFRHAPSSASRHLQSAAPKRIARHDAGPAPASDALPSDDAFRSLIEPPRAALGALDARKMTRSR